MRGQNIIEDVAVLFQTETYLSRPPASCVFTEVSLSLRASSQDCSPRTAFEPKEIARTGLPVVMAASLLSLRTKIPYSETPDIQLSKDKREEIFSSRLYRDKIGCFTTIFRKIFYFFGFDEKGRLTLTKSAILKMRSDFFKCQNKVTDKCFNAT